MKSKRYLIPFFLSFLIGAATFFLWIKREEAKKGTTVPQILEVSHEQEEVEDEEIALPTEMLVEPTREEPTITPTRTAGPVTETEFLSEVQSDSIIKGVEPPPTHPYYQPSSDDPEKTIEAFLKAAKKGDPENFKYFLNSEARRNETIHLVPEGWDGILGTAIIEGRMKGDARTVKVIVAFYKGRDLNVAPVEKIGYFLVKSFGKWLIFDTVLEEK